MSLCIAEVAESNRSFLRYTMCINWFLRATTNGRIVHATTQVSVSFIYRDDYSIQVYVRVPTHYHFEAF
ncbi:hypothetical protein T03_16158 [Trichinella britovi]|uniref:Uncharacterized protein n=1 Tax=Trichinella britovi TaxID=45882 RepID=A0A0V1DC30_TRIBR|nr:hypothetical protein T03_16158 [Trichinella britovi]